MRPAWKIAVVVALAAAVAGTVALRGAKRAGDAASQGRPAAAAPVAAPAAGQPPAAAPVAAPATPAATPPAAPVARGVPRLLEVGSSRCMACKQMAEVLEQLRASQGAKLRVDFIDVFENPGAGEGLGVALIPTQILYDGAGREIFRHTGFFSHDDILAKFRALGVQL